MLPDSLLIGLFMLLCRASLMIELYLDMLLQEAVKLCVQTSHAPKIKLRWFAEMLVESPAIGALLAGLLGPPHTSKRLLHALIMIITSLVGHCAL